MITRRIKGKIYYEFKIRETKKFQNRKVSCIDTLVCIEGESHGHNCEICDLFGSNKDSSAAIRCNQVICNGVELNESGSVKKFSKKISNGGKPVVFRIDKSFIGAKSSFRYETDKECGEISCY